MTNATTGSERIVPGQPPAGEHKPLPARLVRPAVTHWQFGLAVLAAIVARVVVILGYPPILWFNDSYNYILDATTHVPDAVRPNGYPFFLDLLLPLHSDYPIALLQAAMGVAVGTASYALLRHRGLPWWGAALPALPVLFDSYELHLEHMITADPLFTFLVTIAVVMLCWSDRPSFLTMTVAGLLIGYATIVRSVGEPMLAVFLVAMLIRRAVWRPLLALAVAGIVPIGAYMIWFHASYGQYAMTESSGTFLYSRVSTFAECSKINPPADLRTLCDPTPPDLRPVAGEYIWADNETGADSRKTTPLYNLTQTSNNALRFTAMVNAETGTFARDAILAQPLDYLRVVADDTLHTFGWNRQPDPNDYAGNGPAFQFDPVAPSPPWWAGPATMSQAAQWESHYGSDVQANQIYQARQDFGGTSLGNTSTARPWAHLLRLYQRYIYLRGTLLGLIVLIGAAGVVARWRRWGDVVLLPWLVGALLILLPPMTSGFSYRYVLAAVPAACLAAGLAFARRPGRALVPDGDDGAGPISPDAGGRPSRSVGALAADLRRHLRRGGAVDQE